MSDINDKILSKLDTLDSTMNTMREQQVTDGVIISNLAADSQATATGITKLVALQEAKQTRDIADADREAAKQIADADRKERSSDKWWSFVSDNWKYAAVLIGGVAGSETLKQISALVAP